MKFKMHRKIIAAAAVGALAFASVISASAQSIIAEWTFETTAPTTAGPFNPEVGAGAASGFHVGAAAYSSPVGDGSSHSFSANTWATGDYYQFKVSTVGYQAIQVHYNQTSSSTGPTSFSLQYSTDGTTFTQFGANYTVGTTSWSSGTSNASTTINTDLTSVGAINNAATVYFRLVDASATGATAGTDRTDNFAVSGSPVTTTSAPTITGISPASLTTNAGSTVVFSLTSTTGNPPASNYWYKVSGSTTSLVASATSTSLVLSNVVQGDSAGYFAILSNTVGSATSSIAMLTVTGDPAIISQPVSVAGLLDGTSHFSVGVAATSPTYQWYYSDLSSNIIAPVGNGSLPSGGYALGANTATLTLTNLQYATATNFLVVVTGTYGSLTSSLVSLSVTNTAILAFWNFNQLAFPSTLTSPAPWFGSGTASAVGCAVESGAMDPNDNTPLSYIPNSGLGATNYSWATFTYPATNASPSLASNKLAGVQYLTSTAGVKNIRVTYDSRVSPTASDYERLQYTTNGTTWTDFPASSTFNGLSGVGSAGFYSFSNNLTGFSGVDNNPNFGIRIVTEFQNTATYGISTTTNYVGTANNYGTGGTVTYDLVTIMGDAITNDVAQPVVSPIPNTNTLNYVPLQVAFTVTGSVTSPDLLGYTATTLNNDFGQPTGFTPTGVNPSFSFAGSGANRTLTITPNATQTQVDAAPIQVTVYDPYTGVSAATSFILTVTSGNLAPTNSLTQLPLTNVLANSSITIPFSVSDDRTLPGGLLYSVATANSTLIPAGNITISGQGTANPSVTITPATNQLGTAEISVTVNDNDTMQPARSTTAKIAVVVRPNTNVVAIDYFSFDASGPLDVVGTNLWGHLSGITKQLQVVSPSDSAALFGNGYAIVDTFDNTENLQAPLLGAPYLTSSTNVLYMSFLANMDSTRMPYTNGSYFILFNDGSGVTGPYACRVFAATNGAAAGFYRIGVANTAASALNAQMFPMDLSPDTNYTVVASEVLATGQSTLWINPVTAASLSVTDTSAVGTNLYNISDVELRESGATAGSVRIAKLKVGTTFDSVLPSLQINVSGTNAILTSSDPTLGVQAATNVMGPYVDVSASTPYTNNISTNAAVYFRFGQ